jgi:hypothetical protein
MTTQNVQKSDLSKRLEAIGWALFLIMIGGIWLVPNERVPQGAWLIGAGLIMLGLNVARHLSGIKISGFSIVLGLLALILGVSGFLGARLPFFPILLILIGAGIVLKRLFEGKSQAPERK